MHWFLVLVSAIFGYAVFRLFLFVIRVERMKSQMPPGPPGLPLLGNILEIGGKPWLKFAEWSERYGLSVPRSRFTGKVLTES